MADIDVGYLSEAINDKADRDLNNTQPLARTVVEVSDKSLLPSWYRVYSDGWCEQGGTANDGDVIFIKKFINTNYNINSCAIQSGIRYWSFIHSKTKTSFNHSYSDYGGTGSIITTQWQASGYIR